MKRVKQEIKESYKAQRISEHHQTIAQPLSSGPSNSPPTSCHCSSTFAGPPLVVVIAQLFGCHRISTSYLHSTTTLPLSSDQYHQTTFLSPPGHDYSSTFVELLLIHRPTVVVEPPPSLVDPLLGQHLQPPLNCHCWIVT